MNLCDKNHDEVCYEGRACPACELLKQFTDEKQDLQNEIDGLKQVNNDLTEQIANLEQQLNEPLVKAVHSCNPQ
jgi:hypothetical protein